VSDGGDPIERTDYVDTFFKELSPVWLNYVAALHGVAPRPVDHPFTYIELGCGFGQSAVTHAAANPNGTFYACDINPRHVAAAREYARVLGVTNIHIVEASFDDLVERDLPDFDFVVLHGVYSWIGDDAKRAVCAFIRRRLKPGGFAYVSYNCLPGWALEIPLRRLFRELSAVDDDVDAALTRGLRSLDRLGDSKLGFFTAHPAMRDLAKSFAQRAPGYLAHEYLGEQWSAYYSVDVADDMRDADLYYLGSATLADNHPALTTGDDAAAAIAALPSARQRTLADDFATNRAFRRDVFVRGPLRARNPSHLNEVVLARLAPIASLEARARVPRGVVTFQGAFIEALRRVLADGTLAIATIIERLRDHAANANEIIRNLTILIAAGELMPAARVDRYGTFTAGRAHIDPTASSALRYAVEHRVTRALPSLLLGNGVDVRPVEALALIEYLAVPMNAAQLARGIAGRLDREHWLRDADRAQADVVALEAATRVVDILMPMYARLGLATPA